MMRLLGCLFVLCGAALAQSDRGSITGVVTDPAGAVVPGAAVEARNTANGGVYQAATTGTGNYTLSEMPTGPYEVSITVPGFKKFVRQGLDLQVRQIMRIDAKLEVGQASESVTVTEAAPLLKTESGELSHNVTSERLSELPVGQIGAVRNLLTGAQLLPGVVYAPNSVRLNGAPTNSQNTRIDGQDASYGLGPSLASVLQPSVDAVQELAIQTSNYSAEFGQAGGGVFNVTMRSGTNQFHGSAYDYFANEALNAYGTFTHARAKLRRNDYGFTVGGPVVLPKLYDGRNKTFFFYSWEDLPQSAINNTTFNTVPTLAYRAGDFSAATAAVNNRVLGTDPLGRAIIQNAIYDPATERTVTCLAGATGCTAGASVVARDAFAGNRIPTSRFDPISAKIQSLVPLPAGPNVNSLIQNGLYPYDTDNRNNISSIKLDHNLNTSHKLSFFWSRTRSNSNFSPGAPIGGGAEGLPQPISEASSTRFSGNRYTLSYDYTVTPTMLFHLGAGYQDSGLRTYAPTTGYDATKELGLKGPFQPYTFPNFTGMVNATYGGLKNLGEILQGEQNTLMQKPTAIAGLTWVKSNHTYKFGAEMRLQGYPNYNVLGTNGTYAFNGAQTALPYLNSVTVAGNTIGFPYASFLLGLVDTGNIRVPAVSRLGNQQWGFFAQDTWKVTRRLTLDYGLRFDYSTYQKEQYGRQANFSPSTPNPAVGGRLGAAIYEASCNCDFARNYPWAFGPRLGFAYQLNTKTVARGGFGIIYDGTAINNIATRAVTSSNPFSSGFGQPAMALNQGVPFTAAQIAWPNFSAGYYPLPGLAGPPSFIDPNAGRPARQYEWSIGLQRQVLRDLAVEATYVGNRGIWWPAGILANYNANTADSLKAYGLDINSAADRAILNSAVSAPAAGRFQNVVPYAGFPTNLTVAQTLRPYPQFSSGLTPTWAPLGATWYNSLQVKATKRLSHGLDFTYAFTYQKSLNLGSESAGGGGVVNDVFNRKINKVLSASDQRFSTVIGANYTVPKWGGNKYLSFAVSNWQIGAILNYSSGLPILSPNSQNQLNNLLFRANAGTAISFANRVPGEPLFLKDLNCRCFDPNKDFVLNRAAWTDPTPGTFGSAAPYYNDYRNRRRPSESMNFGRQFRITERTNLSIRAEFTNIFNRTLFPAITSANALAAQTRVNNADPTTNINGGFGWVNTAVTTNVTPRSGQLVARFRF
jgi:Carboxypeptidase regulatory-like domain